MGKLWAAMLKAAPLRLWALLGAGPPLTAGAAALVWIVWKGGWPAALAGQQLQILGLALFGVLGLIAVIMIALAAIRVKGAGPGGVSFELDGDPTPPAPIVTTTTTTAVAAQPAPAPTEAPL